MDVDDDLMLNFIFYDFTYRGQLWSEKNKWKIPEIGNSCFKYLSLQVQHGSKKMMEKIYLMFKNKK